MFCSRETGALNRIIDRGSRAINFILSSMVFNVVPTILEVCINYSYVPDFFDTVLMVCCYIDKENIFPELNLLSVNPCNL